MLNSKVQNESAFEFEVGFFSTLLKPNRISRWMLFSFFSWKKYPSFLLLQKRTINSDGKRLNDLWVIRDKKDGQIRIFNHNVRLYEIMHLRGLLENAGFAVNQVYGDYNGQGFSFNSNRLVLVAAAT